MKIYVKINLMILNFLFKIYCVPACFLYNNHGLIKTNQKVSNCKQKEAEMYDIGSRITHEERSYLRRAGIAYRTDQGISVPAGAQSDIAVADNIGRHCRSTGRVHVEILCG